VSHWKTEYLSKIKGLRLRIKEISCLTAMRSAPSEPAALVTQKGLSRSEHITPRSFVFPEPFCLMIPYICPVPIVKFSPFRAYLSALSLVEIPDDYWAGHGSFFANQ